MSNHIIIVVSSCDVTKRKASKWGSMNGCEVITCDKKSLNEKTQNILGQRTNQGHPDLLPVGSETISNNIHENLVPLVKNEPLRKQSETIQDIIKHAIEAALRQTGGNIMAASKLLGMGRATVYRKIKSYDIDKSSYRKDKVKIKIAA